LIGHAYAVAINVALRTTFITRRAVFELVFLDKRHEIFHDLRGELDATLDRLMPQAKAERIDL
jgi:hypothetical protein